MIFLFMVRSYGICRWSHGCESRKFGMMGIMALVAGEMLFWSIIAIPVTVNPSMDAGFPVPVGHSVAFSTEASRLVFWNHTAIMIGICIRIITVMAIETSEVQAVGKKHILVCSERKM
jgi:hypothetical protein